MSALDATVGDHHSGPEHEVRSLRQLFRERRLSVRTMEPRLRLATGAAAASLLGTVLLIALRDVGTASVSLGRNGEVVTAVSAPLFVATLVLLTIGLAYVLTGAVLAGTPIAIIALIAIMVEIGLHTGAFGSVFGLDLFSLYPSWATWSARAVLAAVAGLALAVIGYDRRRGTDVARHARLTILLGFAGLFGAFFVILKVASPEVGHLDLFPESISTFMLDIADLVTPLLFIAAVDFGEWGGLLGERVASAIKIRRATLLAPAAAVIALALLGYGYAQLCPAALVHRHSGLDRCPHHAHPRRHARADDRRRPGARPAQATLARDAQRCRHVRRRRARALRHGAARRGHRRQVPWCLDAGRAGHPRAAATPPPPTSPSSGVARANSPIRCWSPAVGSAQNLKGGDGHAGSTSALPGAKPGTVRQGPRAHERLPAHRSTRRREQLASDAQDPDHRATSSTKASSSAST